MLIFTVRVGFDPFYFSTLGDKFLAGGHDPPVPLALPLPVCTLCLRERQDSFAHFFGAVRGSLGDTRLY